MPPTLHIVFNHAVNLKKALTQLGRADEIIVFPENLAVGPINPPDPDVREHWRKFELQCDEEDWPTEDVNAFWSAALSEKHHRVAWTSRRSVQDHTGFMEFVRRLGDAPCDVVDLTTAIVDNRRFKGKLLPPRFAGSLGTVNASQIIDNGFLDRVRPLTAEMRASYRRQWEKLRAENAPLRVVGVETEIVSAPIWYFDDLLFSFVQKQWRKSAYVIGCVLSTWWESDLAVAGDDFLATRLQALVDAGRIEAVGDVHKIRFSEVRLPAAKV